MSRATALWAAAAFAVIFAVVVGVALLRPLTGGNATEAAPLPPPASGPVMAADAPSDGAVTTITSTREKKDTHDHHDKEHDDDD